MHIPTVTSYLGHAAETSCMPLVDYRIDPPRVLGHRREVTRCMDAPPLSPILPNKLPYHAQGPAGVPYAISCRPIKIHEGQPLAVAATTGSSSTLNSPLDDPRIVPDEEVLIQMFRLGKLDTVTLLYRHVKSPNVPISSYDGGTGLRVAVHL